MISGTDNIGLSVVLTEKGVISLTQPHSLEMFTHICSFEPENFRAKMQADSGLNELQIFCADCLETVYTLHISSTTT